MCLSSPHFQSPGYDLRHSRYLVDAEGMTAEERESARPFEGINE